MPSPRALKVILTEEEVLEVRSALLVRLHVERINGGGTGPRDQLLSTLLRKLGYTAHLPRAAPPEGEGKE